MNKQINTNGIKTVLILFFISACISQPMQKFDEENAFELLRELSSYGPRIPDSEPSMRTVSFIEKYLIENGWDTNLQHFTKSNCSGTNVLATKGSGKSHVLLGTHFDSRSVADAFTKDNKFAVPGANDGLSGTAVLLEISRQSMISLDKKITLAFFDCEDQGGINNQEWATGAAYFVENIQYQPNAVVIIDMVGDEDLLIYREVNSDTRLSDEIWDTAQKLEFQNVFINQKKYSLLDDHFPFLQIGIPASLIIDFDYPYWHTTEDTIDKIEKNSLQIVGNVILEWLRTY